MADETGLVFVIGGDEYPAPMMDTFDMAERRVMFELAGIVEEDGAREEGETEDEYRARLAALTRHVGFMEALMHIAYARGNPDLKRAKVQEIIDRTNYKQAIQKWADADQAADADDQASESTSEHARTSPSGSVDSSGTSGDGSRSGSVGLAAIPGSTGTGPSDTSPTSDRSLSVA